MMQTPAFPKGVVYIAPGQPHRTQWDGYGELLNLYFTERLLEELAEEGRCPLEDARSAYRMERGVFEIGHLLMDEFAWTGELSPLARVSDSFPVMLGAKHEQYR